MENEDPSRVDPVLDLIEIGQFADADREQLLKLVLWLAPNMRSCRKDNAEMVDRGQLAWAPVQLETVNVEFDTSCLGTTVEIYGMWEVIHKDSLTRIEREGNLMGIIKQCRYRLLEAECVILQIPIEYLCDYIPEGIAYINCNPFGRYSTSSVRCQWNSALSPAGCGRIRSGLHCREGRLSKGTQNWCWSEQGK
jgi:hypothetical protein